MNLKLLKIARFFHLINKKDYNEKRQIEIVKNSPLFDAKWYLAQNPDVKSKKIGAAKHYVKYGWKEGRNPSPDFDTEEYLHEYPELEEKNWCPLFHYMLEHKELMPKIDYKEQILNLLDKYTNKYEGKSKNYIAIAKSKYFNKNWYLRTYPDVKKAKIDPIEHYMKYGWKEGYNPSPMFNTEGYLSRYPDVKKANVNPLLHYEKHGRKEGRYYRDKYRYSSYGKLYNILRILGRVIYRKQIKLNNNARILVHLHMFYPEAWEEIKEYLKNLNVYQYDLIVTHPDFLTDKTMFNDIRLFSPSCKIMCVSNKGFDIGPFIDIISKINLTKYDIIYHLHSKSISNRRLVYNRLFIGKSWFQQLFSGCLGVFNVHKGIDILLHNKNIGQIAAKNLIFEDTTERQKIVIDYAIRLGIQGHENYKFVGGSCFGIKAELLYEIKNLKLDINDFIESKRYIFTLAHAMERIISISVQNQGYRIYPMTVIYNNHKLAVWKNIRQQNKRAGQIISKLQKEGIRDIIPLKLDILSGLRCSFYKGFWQNKQVFIKYGGNPEVVKNEYEMQKKYHEILPENVLEPLLYNTNENNIFIVTEYLEGYNLEELQNLRLTKDEKLNIKLQLLHIKNIIKKYPYMHRDIRPSNLIYSKKKLYLIDFQFAVQINNQTFKELQFLLDRPKTRLVLGDEFRKSEEEWDDLYSIDRIYEMLN